MNTRDCPGGLLHRLHKLASTLQLGGMVDTVRLYRFGARNDQYGMRFDGGEAVLQTPVGTTELQVWDVRLKPRSSFDAHRHPCREYLFVRDGELRNDRTGGIIRPSRRAIFDPHEMHEVSTVHGCRLTMVWMPALHVEIVGDG